VAKISQTALWLNGDSAPRNDYSTIAHAAFSIATKFKTYHTKSGS